LFEVVEDGGYLTRTVGGEMMRWWSVRARARAGKGVDESTERVDMNAGSKPKRQYNRDVHVDEERSRLDICRSTVLE
jgi:hypothetical protein